MERCSDKRKVSAEIILQISGQKILTLPLIHWSHSLFFENFMPGTRTRKGTGSLSLAIPPTPGQSIVRRPDNEDMFSMAMLWSKRLWCELHLGGGNSFDNMGYFFRHNTRWSTRRYSQRKGSPQVTAWVLLMSVSFGYSPGAKSYAPENCSFNHIMTVSNHRVYLPGRQDWYPFCRRLAGVLNIPIMPSINFWMQLPQKPGSITRCLWSFWSIVPKAPVKLTCRRTAITSLFYL